MSVILFQVGITGLALLCISVYYIPQLRNSVEFYSAFGFTLVSIVVMLHVLLEFSAVVWIVSLAFEDMLMVSTFSKLCAEKETFRLYDVQMKKSVMKSTKYW